MKEKIMTRAFDVLAIGNQKKLEACNKSMQKIRIGSILCIISGIYTFSNMIKFMHNNEEGLDTFVPTKELSNESRNEIVELLNKYE